jgi:aspartate/methionine/tyrosine aminotransferase
MDKREPCRIHGAMKNLRARAAHRAVLCDGGGQGGRRHGARGGRQTDAPMIYLNIGEPDFTAPPLVQEAATSHPRRRARNTPRPPAACAARAHQPGIAALWVDVPARRIVVTAGASAALQLACLALIEAGDEMLMPDPSYPCNRHFVSAADGRAVLIPTTAAERFQLSAATRWQPPGARTHAACCWPRPPTPPARRFTPMS